MAYNQPPDRRCKGKTADGSQCKHFAMRGKELCSLHDPTHPHRKNLSEKPVNLKHGLTKGIQPEHRSPMYGLIEIRRCKDNCFLKTECGAFNPGKNCRIVNGRIEELGKVMDIEGVRQLAYVKMKIDFLRFKRGHDFEEHQGDMIDAPTNDVGKMVNDDIRMIMQIETATGRTKSPTTATVNVQQNNITTMDVIKSLFSTPEKSPEKIIDVETTKQ